MTLDIRGGVFDLLDEVNSPNPIIEKLNDLLRNVGPNDFGSFSFNSQTSFDSSFSPTSTSLNLSQITQFSGSFIFGGPQSLALGADSFGTSDDLADPLVFGGGTGPSTTLNFNLVSMVEFSIEQTIIDPEGVDIGSMLPSEYPDDDPELLA